MTTARAHSSRLAGAAGSPVAGLALAAWLSITPAAAADLPALSPDFPTDVDLPASTIIPVSAQRVFDLFSWQTFVAANWPRAADGGPDPSRRIGEGGDHPAVWEAWLEDYDLLVPAGQRPLVWADGPRPPPATCQGLAEAGTAHLAHITKAPDLASAFIEPDGSGPLIDQRGRYVRYQISVNQTMYDYIRGHDLYSASGLRRAKPIDFPSGSRAADALGAVSVKAAWRILDPADDASRFHTDRVLVADPDGDCQLETVGLVGLHFAHKTETAPQWIWSTFEHVDNAPTKGAPTKGAPTKGAPPGTGYSFFDPGCDPSACPVNAPLPPPWDPDKLGPPSQVERVVPIDPETGALNSAYQELLRGVDPDSVWANYQLVGTQRPRAPQAKDDPIGYPWPQFLANTTMETFLQGTVPTASSSCVECHARATTFTGAFADYSYLLARVSGSASSKD